MLFRHTHGYVLQFSDVCVIEYLLIQISYAYAPSLDWVKLGKIAIMTKKSYKFPQQAEVLLVDFQLREIGTHTHS